MKEIGEILIKILAIYGIIRLIMDIKEKRIIERFEEGGNKIKIIKNLMKEIKEENGRFSDFRHKLNKNGIDSKSISMKQFVELSKYLIKDKLNDNKIKEIINN